MSEYQEHRTASPARGLAITALILGIIAVITAAVPVLGFVLGVVALILGIVALKKKQSKGLSVTGLVLGAIAAVVSVIVTTVIIATAGLFIAALEEGDLVVEEVTVESEPLTQQEAADGSAEETSPSDTGRGLRQAAPLSPSTPITWDQLDTARAPVSTQAGTNEDPHPLGSSFTISGLEVVLNFVDLDAADSVRVLAPENEMLAADERYVLIHMTVNNPTSEPADVAQFRVHYDTPKRMYAADASSYARLITPEPELLERNRQIIGNFSGYILLVTKDVDGELVRLFSADHSEEIWVAVK